MSEREGDSRDNDKGRERREGEDILEGIVSAVEPGKRERGASTCVLAVRVKGGLCLGLRVRELCFEKRELRRESSA